MRTFLRSKVTLLFITCAVLLAVPAIALADNISNNLDTSVDAVAENMPLNQDGAAGTTRLYIDATNLDGKNGCNLTGGKTATVDLSSSDTSVATVSPASVTFTSCVTSTTGPVVTVTPHNAGTATISGTLTSNTTDGTFNVAPIKFTVNVAPPPNNPPNVTVSGVTGGASYDKGSVPAATCNVTDAEDGPSSFPATLSAVTGPYASDGIGSQTASCSYTDNGPGTPFTATDSLTYNIVDPSAPVINKTVTGQQGNNGWYTGNVNVDWTVSEPESPNSLTTSGCNDFSVTSDQDSTTYTCTATSAGGMSNDSVTIKRDATAPTNIAFTGGGLTDSASYDFGSVPAPPTGCTADDALSGLNGCAVTGYSTAVGPHTLTATATDNAGNVQTKALSYTVSAATAHGFYQPVDMSGTVNTVKSGSTVPVKFELFGGATNVEQKTLGAVGSMSASKVSCGNLSGDPMDAIEYLAPTSEPTGLRFDTTGDQFIYNWKTPAKAANTCYSLTMTAADQQTKLVSYFKLT